jgi:hypothetical protein
MFPECALHVPLWLRAAAGESARLGVRLLKIDDDVGDDDNKPVWPTWAVGALFGGRSSMYSHQLRLFSQHSPAMEESGHPREGQEEAFCSISLLVHSCY